MHVCVLRSLYFLPQRDVELLKFTSDHAIEAVLIGGANHILDVLHLELRVMLNKC
jgi:hypothetical protein